jgi:[ribosomal protein S18]-alanine N-acetyltransferase
MEHVCIRKMTLDDIDGICEVEKESFTVPWSREAFCNEMTKNHFAFYLVLEIDGKIAGYGGMWIIVDEAHITNIAIARDYRGKKLGEKLLHELTVEAKKQGVVAMTLEVRKSNYAAQNLYRKFGFEETGIRPKYYSDNGEDALIMWVNFQNEAEQQMETKSS